MDIGRRLRIARESIGYTQKKAAEESGIGETSISDFENSNREPKFSQLSKLAEVYRKTIDFFLTDEPFVPDTMLWRDAPEAQEEMRKTEAEFHQLCEQYRNLEILVGEVKDPKLPVPDIIEAQRFGYDQAELLAKRIQDEFRLGDVPIASLKQILEEIHYIKIFYLNFEGSAISTVSEKFGPAIVLNARNKQWRRSYDLAHEFFHLLTWTIFRRQSKVESEDEYKLANAFASRLLMPEEAIKDRVRAVMNSEGQIDLDHLDDIAREFDVSLVALIYRIAAIYRLRKEESAKHIDLAERYLRSLKPRPSHKPAKLPERYCDLALRALRDGRLSLMQFAKYMGMSYKKAQEYLTEDKDFKDERISISVA
jgi:Zn-dependent peptidase ImmA (M78 family)/DNA-binding XRE family transcriptional regulator